MKHTNKSLWMVLVLAGALTGCDEPPPKQIAAPAPPPADRRPTTQEILSQPQKTLALSPLPLSVDVPDSWVVKQSGDLVFLQGPTPNGMGVQGEVFVQLMRMGNLPPVNENYIRQLEIGAQEDRKKEPNRYRLINLRQLDRAWVLERREVLPARSMGGVDEQGNALAGLPPMMKWTLMVFVPYQNYFMTCQLNFLNLTLDQYEKDIEILQRIVGSVRYDPANAAMDIPAPAGR